MAKIEKVRVLELSIGETVMVDADAYGYRFAKPDGRAYVNGASSPFGDTAQRGTIANMRNMWNHRGAHFSIELADGRMIEMAYRDFGQAYRVVTEPTTPAAETAAELIEVLARSGARVHLAAANATLTMCGLNISGPANGYDGTPCTDCREV